MVKLRPTPPRRPPSPSLPAENPLPVTSFQVPSILPRPLHCVNLPHPPKLVLPSKSPRRSDGITPRSVAALLNKPIKISGGTGFPILILSLLVIRSLSASDSFEAPVTPRSPPSSAHSTTSSVVPSTRGAPSSPRGPVPELGDLSAHRRPLVPDYQNPTLSGWANSGTNAHT